MNLNHLAIENADGPEVPLQDASTSSADGSVTVYFRSIEDALLHHIEAADIVVGCVAWLSSKRVLRHLARKHSVALVVQKEDFLRPDSGQPRARVRTDLRPLYNALPSRLQRLEYPDLVGSLSVCGDPTMDPVRCLGPHNVDRRFAIPSAHHKFAVFCHLAGATGERTIEPYEVWTGSYNWTSNAARSMENAVVLTDSAIVRAFYKEWEQAYAVSEPLDWDAPWVTPLRIGS